MRVFVVSTQLVLLAAALASALPRKADPTSLNTLSSRGKEAYHDQQASSEKLKLTELKPMAAGLSVRSASDSEPIPHHRLDSRDPWPSMNKREAFLILGLDQYRKLMNWPTNRPTVGDWKQAADWAWNNYANHISLQQWNDAIFAFTQEHSGAKTWPTQEEITQADTAIHT